MRRGCKYKKERAHRTKETTIDAFEFVERNVLFFVNPFEGLRTIPFDFDQTSNVRTSRGSSGTKSINVCGCHEFYSTKSDLGILPNESCEAYAEVENFCVNHHEERAHCVHGLLEGSGLLRDIDYMVHNPLRIASYTQLYILFIWHGENSWVTRPYWHLAYMALDVARHYESSWDLSRTHDEFGSSIFLLKCRNDFYKGREHELMTSIVFTSNDSLHQWIAEHSENTEK